MTRAPGCTQELLALPKTLNLARGHAQPRETRTDPEQMGYSVRRFPCPRFEQASSRIRTRGHGEVQENYTLKAVVFA
jgi:hypothetical protein